MSNSGANMADGFQGVHRALGRIEGKQEQILTELSAVKTTQAAHEAEDDRRFENTNKAINKRFDELNGKLQIQASTVRNALDERSGKEDERMKGQDEKLESLQRKASFAKGVSWVVMGLLGFVTITLSGVAVVVITDFLQAQ